MKSFWDTPRLLLTVLFPKGEAARGPEDGLLADAQADEAHPGAAGQGDGALDASDSGVVPEQAEQGAPDEADDERDGGRQGVLPRQGGPEGVPPDRGRVRLLS